MIVVWIFAVAIALTRHNDEEADAGAARHSDGADWRAWNSVGKHGSLYIGYVYIHTYMTLSHLFRQGTLTVAWDPDLSSINS